MGYIATPINDLLEPARHGGDQVPQVLAVLHPGHPQLDDLLLPSKASLPNLQLFSDSLEWNFSFPKLNCSSLVLAGERFPPLSHAAGKLRIVRKSSTPLSTSQTKSFCLGRKIFALSIPQGPLNTAPLPTGVHITCNSI